jgi:hypothetical protein
LKQDWKNQRIIDQKDQALKEAREYITDTEKKYFNTKNFRKKGPFGMIKDNPPDEAFQHYLLHNKGYNKIINKIDENLGKDR